MEAALTKSNASFEQAVEALTEERDKQLKRNSIKCHHACSRFAKDVLSDEWKQIHEDFAKNVAMLKQLYKKKAS